MANEDERKKYYDEQQNGHSLLGVAITAGAVIGAGALGWRYRSQIGAGIRSTSEFAGTLGAAGISRLARSAKLKDTWEDLGTFAKAMNYAMDNRSIVSHAMNPGRFEDRFSASLQRSLEARGRSASDPFRGEPLEFEERLTEMRSKRRQVFKATVASQRMQYIEEELRNKLPNLPTNDIMSMLSNHGSWMHNSNFGIKHAEGFVDHVLENASALNHNIQVGKDQRQDFVDTVFEVADRYRTSKANGFTEGNRKKTLMDAVRKNKKNLWDDFIESNTEPSKIIGANKQKAKDFRAKVMGNNGYFRPTIGDAADHKYGNLFDFRGSMLPRKTGASPFVNSRLAKRVDRISKIDSRFEDVMLDKNVWMNSREEFLDTRWMARGAVNFADNFRRSVHIPFLRFNPLDLLHFTTWEGMREAPRVAIRRIGTIDPALHGSVVEYNHPLAHNADAAVGVLGRNYMQTGAGKVYDMTTGDLVKEGIYQASGRFGMVPRALAGMANLHTKDYRDFNFFENLFDFKLGRQQETDAVWSRMASAVTKFDNPEWGRNILNSLASGRLDPEDAYKLIHSQFESKSTALSDDVISYIGNRVNASYGNIGIDVTKLNSPQEIMEALGKLNHAILTPGSDIAKVSSKPDGALEGIDKLINETWLKYSNDQQAFMRNKRIRTNNAIYMPEWASALDMQDTQMVEKVDDVKRLIHMHSLRQLEYATGDTGKVTVGSLVQQGIKEGKLGEKSLSEVRNLETLGDIRQWWNDIYRGREDDKHAALMDFAGRMTNDKDILSAATQQGLKEFNSTIAMGPGEEPPQYFGLVNNLSMNKAKGYKWALANYNQETAKGVSPVYAALDSAVGVAGQFFAGRKNLGNVTTATLFPYYFAERLDNAVSHVGFGLSQRNRGSFQSILGNQFLRRIVLPYAAYQQVKWADGILGDQPSDTAAQAYVNMRTDASYIKEFLGLNDISRQWSRVFEGGDQLTETPFFRAFDFMTFGMLGDNRSGDDEKQYWESGEDPVRKGRYWSIGSGTPYTGGKIDRYEPNWYRRMRSDYMFTNTMYGSESEYWANNWMPTLTHPFAPINHFLLDPYHWEKKHKDDRPYPETGGFAELEQIPIIGSALDNTVGEFLKPRLRDPRLRRAHREYLAEMNANIQSQYDQMGQGGYLQGMPAGGTGLIQDGQASDMGIDFGGGGDFNPGDAAAAGIHEKALSGIGGGRGSGGATGQARAQIALINAAMSDIGGPALGATGKNIRSVTSLEDLRDPDVIANLHDIGDMGSLGGMLRDSVYSTTEMGGIYGFLSKSAVGWDESGRGMVLDTSNRMTSFARSWWDNELGGLGGGLSEIFRRYVPRDPNKNYWNPIRNRMPFWMPGPDYFIDFQHGDPYVKVPHGEMRLPGDAYETLYKLHPDAFGKYGAFDRYRILADVAPYSEQFKLYKAIVSRMNANGMLDEKEQSEFGEIRDQVSARKEKYRFYERRFDHADVNYETVHITRMLDATTFMTKEHPYNPVRMAGVKVKASDEESIQWLQQYVHEGATVRIATDSDPLNQVRDDTYGTIRAVVYAGNRGDGLPFYMSNRGQNVNFMLANRKSGGFMGLGGKYTASVHDDGTATSTRALFSNDMITVGKMWEGLTHDLLPSLPIVGTIADKFLQVRSPLEMYKRQEIYGKAWRPWTSPWSGWIQPAIENMAAQHPVVAALQGAGIGWLFTKVGAHAWGTHIGAAIGGAAATIRVFNEHFHKLTSADGDTWIPERRRKEREINEYFDMLRYMKYHGLYEKARVEAIHREGIDVEELMNENEQRGQKNKGKRKVLQSMKKWLSMSKKMGYGDREAEDEQLGNIRDELKQIEGDRPLRKLGAYTMLALRYKSEYESTLYGADPNGDMTKIFRALPNKDREFFQKFMTAAPDEREEILRIIPKNERRFFQAKWGLKVDKPESLQHYFSHHYLPGSGWAGWKPDVSLENYKVKVIKNEGLDLTEFGDWSDDDKRAEQSNARAIPMTSLSATIDVGRIEKVLRGAGLHDVNVTMETSHGKDENKISLAMNVMKDRSKDLVNEINNNLGGLISSMSGS